MYAGGGQPLTHGIDVCRNGDWGMWMLILSSISLILQNGKSSIEAEKAVMEEFGRCLTQIINSAQSGMEIFNFDDHLPFICSLYIFYSHSK